MRNIFFTLGCFTVIILAGVILYLYNKPSRNVAGETGIPVTAKELYQKFTSNESQANQTYLNKVVEVKGQVLEVKNTQHAGKVVVLSTGDPLFGVACSLDNAQTQEKDFTPGQQIVVKGVCTGYLSDVVLTHGYLMN
jgi:putative nucleic acid binding protein